MTARKPRMHMLDPARSGVATAGICGHIGTTTTRPSKVTCKACLRAIAAAAATLAAAAETARRNAPPAVLSGRGQTDVGHVGARAIASSIAGEVVTSGPRWGSVASALAAWAMTADARRSVASSSSPDRFGQRGGSDGGPTPTTPRGTQHDLLDVEAALERGCQPMRVGEHSLTRATVRAIVEARLCGKPIDRAVGPRVTGPVARMYEEAGAGTSKAEAKRAASKRGTYRERIEASADEVAERAGLTRHQVGLVVRAARRAIAVELARKGLIPERVALREMVGSKNTEVVMSEWDLEGWKDIAPLVRRSEDVCKRLSKREKDPLPVARYLGRVVAKRAQVEEWARRQTAEAAA